MKATALLSLALLTMAACLLAFSQPAEAARFGGARSFGSKPFMSQPAPRVRPQTPTTQRQPAAAAQSQGTPAPAAGMGRGLLGGLLAGTLIGSLLAGTGFAGGGMLDILLIGLLLFLGLKLFARFRAQQTPQPETNPLFRSSQPQQDAQGNGWDVLRGADNGQGSDSPSGQSPAFPPDFDVDEFLKGAKLAYNRLQASWDKRDMDDIAQFTTSAVQDAVHEQMQADPNPGKTEILLVNAQVLEVVNDGPNQRVQVYFDVLLRENAGQAPNAAREIWHFVRPQDNGHWKLDGIQQVD